MKAVLIAAILLAAISGIGCESTHKEPPAFQVGYNNGLPIGAFSPNLPLITTEGTQTLLSRVAGPVLVVAFLSPTGPAECCHIEPQLADMAEKFQNEYVSVVQVSLPTSLCPHGPGCVEACSMFDRHLLLLCDKDAIAWRGYMHPEPGTVFLVDEDNKIVARENFQNLQTIEKKARQLSNKLRDRYKEIYQG